MPISKRTAAEIARTFVAARDARDRREAARRRPLELARQRAAMRRLRYVRRWAAALPVLGGNLVTAAALAVRDGAARRAA